jgi:dephospho-CoA kinase
MFVIGITGGIGCGKSTVAGICRTAGLPVIDADAISRDVTAAGGAAMPEIIEAFGSGAADPHGALDRQAMARKVFQNHKALDRLSQIIHRHVIDQMGREVSRLADKKTRAVVLDVPIPVKSGFLDLCDQVWVVWADDEVRLARLEARGMEREEARRRMAMQMSRDEYVRLADQLLENNGDEAELAARVRRLLEEELGQRGIRMLPVAAERIGETSEIDSRRVPGTLEELQAAEPQAGGQTDD